MFHSNRFTGVLILVIILNCSVKSTWCASLVASDSAQNLNGNQNLLPSIKTVSSSYSLTPSYAYQFHTNDNEHLDKLVLASQSPSSSSSIDLNESPSQKIISAERRRLDETSSNRVTNLPVGRSSSSGGDSTYNGFDFSAYQQSWKSKEPDFLSATPKAVISQGNDYLSQEGLLQDYSMRGKSASQAAALQKPITIIKSEQILDKASNSSVYSASQRLPTGSPITYQGQQKVHTAASYSSPVAMMLPPMRRMDADGGDDDKSTFAFAPGRLEKRRPVEKRKILQSRQDTVELVAEDGVGAGGDAGAAGAPGGIGVGYGEADEDDDHVHYYDHDGDDHYGHSHGHSQGAPGQSESYDHDHDHDEQEDMSNDSDNGYGYYGDGNGNGGANDLVELHDNDPAIRDFGQGGGGGPFVGGDGHVPIGIGAGAPGPPGLPPPGFPPGPLPPPPVPLKGSIDYILIPLILIGLAGPIFVVLYVILGGFEYRLTPIVRRSLETSYVDYEPYINAVTSSVGRALDKYECVDYAACRFRGLCNQVGLDNVTTSNIETVLNSVTPKNYKPTLNSVFSYLKAPETEKDENCRQFKCASLVDKFPI